MKTLSSRCMATYFGLDALFNPLVVAAALPLLGIPTRWDTILLFALAIVLKGVAASWYIATRLKPYEVYARCNDLSRRRELVQAADDALQRLPRGLGVFAACSWGVTYLVGFLASHAILPDIGTSLGASYGMMMLFVALVVGSFAFSFPVCTLLTSGPAGRCAVFARESRVPLDRAPSSLQVRIAVIALALGVGPTVWMTALGYMEQLATHQAHTQTQAELAAGRVHESLRAASPTSWETLLAETSAQEAGLTSAHLIVDRDGNALQGTEQARLLLSETSVGPRLATALREEPRGSFAIPGAGYAVAYQSLDDGRYVAAIQQMSAGAASTFMLKAGIFALLIALWAPFCATALGRAASGPLRLLTDAARQIVEEGTQSQMATLPVACNDEVGVLSERFNDLIGMMRDLSVAADAIASGNLTVNIDRQGELPDAFRRMLRSLREIVRQIRETSMELASATTQILAASQEQEAAAASQSSAMEEISRTMDSLSQSAAHVSDAVQGVLSNAEQTFQNTDNMVNRIGKLSALAGRIGQILDVIKEISDRSDLLALNGSLEASRAGDEGTGFGLVATEMRRLAERVTTSVEDIKSLVTDIRESGSTTVMATEESKRLAEGTTDAARQITFVTQQQRSGTEQVSQSVRNIAEVVTQTVSATSQTRSSAEGLKTQAEQLSVLVQRFELSAVAEAP